MEFQDDDVLTMDDLMRDQQILEQQAAMIASKGGADECTYDKGYAKQPVYGITMLSRVLCSCQYQHLLPVPHTRTQLANDRGMHNINPYSRRQRVPLATRLRLLSRRGFALVAR